MSAVSGLPPRPPPTSMPGPGEPRGSGPTSADHLFDVMIVVGMVAGGVAAVALAIVAVLR